MSELFAVLQKIRQSTWCTVPSIESAAALQELLCISQCMGSIELNKQTTQAFWLLNKRSCPSVWPARADIVSSYVGYWGRTCCGDQAQFCSPLALQDRLLFGPGLAPVWRCEGSLGSAVS